MGSMVDSEVSKVSCPLVFVEVEVKGEKGSSSNVLIVEVDKRCFSVGRWVGTNGLKGKEVMFS